MSFKAKYIFIFLIGFLCYIPFMFESQNTWFDEAFSLVLLNYSWSDMFDIIMREDGHPPLYYTLLRLWMSATDYHNIAWARRLGLVYLSITALLGAFPVRRLCGDKIALMFTTLVFFFPTFIYLITDMRMYGLLSFEITAAFTYALLIVRDNKRSDWLKFGIISICMLYTHYYSCFVLAVLYAFLFGHILLHFRQNKSAFYRFLITSGIVAGTFLPWFLFVFLGQTAHMYSNWYPSSQHIIAAYSQMTTIDLLVDFDDLSAFLCSLCTGVLWTLLLQNFIEHKPNQPIVFLTGFLYFGVLILTTIVSLTIRPMMNGRYMEPFAGTLMLGICVVLVRENRFQKLFFTFVFASFWICAINRVVGIYSSFYPNLKKYIHTVVDPKDSVILCDGNGPCMTLAFYFPEYRMRFVQPYGSKSLLIPERLFYQNQLSFDELRQKKLYMYIGEFNPSPLDLKNPYQPFTYFRFRPLTPDDVDRVLSDRPSFTEGSFYQSSNEEGE